MRRRLVADFLADMVNEGRRAQDFVSGLELETFKQDVKTRYAVVRCLEIIGEACKKVPEDVRLRRPQVPWRSVAGMRDKLSHDYLGVDWNVVWSTIQNELAAILPEIESLHREVASEEQTESESNP